MSQHVLFTANASLSVNDYVGVIAGAYCFCQTYQYDKLI